MGKKVQLDCVNCFQSQDKITRKKNYTKKWIDFIQFEEKNRIWNEKQEDK